MAIVGIEEPATRSAVSRLKRRGVIAPAKVAGAAAYALTDPMLDVFDAGDARIFRTTADEDDHAWLLAIFSVPEAERSRRHVLRSRLAGLGFGSVSAGVWIAPSHIADEVRVVLNREDLARFVTLFSGEHIPSEATSDEVAEWWDLGAIDDAYRAFTASHRRSLAAWRRRPGIQPQRACADYVSTVTAWRRLPYLDPGLPAGLLPRRWPGPDAHRVFAQLRERLEPGARAYVAELERQSR